MFRTRLQISGPVAQEQRPSDPVAASIIAIPKNLDPPSNGHLQNSDKTQLRNNGSTKTQVQNYTGGKDSTEATESFVVYRRRFWALLLFSCCSMMGGMAWPQYAISASVNSCYYGVDASAVNWTTLIYLVLYIPLVVPVSWFMDRFGLRKTVMAGAFFNAMCSIVQCLSLNAEGFPMVMVSQTMGSFSNAFVLAVPPFLAAIWFPAEEVSRACSAGVFGNQLGIAFGFIFTPLVTSNDCSDKPLIMYGKSIVAYTLTAINLFLLALVLFTFQNKPKTPPSASQLKKKDTEVPYKTSILNLIKNKHFMFLLLGYGLINAVYFTISTVLNSLILKHFPGNDEAVGWMGLIMIVTGLLGSIIAGYILDYTHKFKQTSMLIFILTLLSLITFSVLVEVSTLWVQYVTIGLLGFFMTSYIPVGFEYASELTYPESEAIAAGLMNTSSMAIGTVFILADSYLLETYGTCPSDIFLCIGVLLGCISTAFVNGECRRVKENEVKQQQSKIAA